MASSFSPEKSYIVTHEAIYNSEEPRESDYGHEDLDFWWFYPKVVFVKGQKS